MTLDTNCFTNPPTFVKSLVMVPLGQAAPIGAIGNYWAATHVATEAEIKLLQSLADIVVIAIEKLQIQAQLEQRAQAQAAIEADLQRQVERQRLMTEMAQRIRQSLNLIEILQTTVEEVRQFLQTDRVLILQFAPDRSGTVVMESVGGQWPSSLATHIYASCLTENYVEHFRQGRITTKSDIYLENIDEHHLDLLVRLAVRANLVVPILQNEHLWGLLIAHHCAAPRPWQPLEIDLLRQLAMQVGIAIQQASLFEQGQWELRERQQAEAALQAKTTELAELYNHAPCGYHSLDRNGTFTRINDTELIMLGYRREVVIGQKTFADLLTIDSRQTFQATLPMFQQQGWIRDLEFQMIRQDGTILPVSLSATATYDQTGNYLTSQSVVLDISDRVGAEANRRLAEAQLRLFVKHVPAGVAMFDREMRHLVTSDRWLTSYGLAGQDITGRSHYEVFPDLPDRWKVIHQNCLAGAMEVCEEDQFLRADGSLEWVRWEIHPWRTSTHEIGGIILFSEVITEQKQAQQKIQEQAALLDIATDAIYVCDLDHHIIYWNQGAERLYGWSAVEVLGQDLVEVLHPRETDFIALAHRQLSEQGAWQGEIQEQTKTQQSVIVESRWTLVRNEAGHPKAILIVSTDITQKQQLELQFLRVQRLESLGTLASRIAHDLNNIFTPILVTAQLLPMKFPDADDKTQQLLHLLEGSARRGADLVQQILAFARGAEGQKALLQIGHLLSEVVQVAEQTFPPTIAIHSQVATQELWLVMADATQLHQVLMNLCANARDAMPTGGTLTMDAENCVIDATYTKMNVEAKPGSYVVITIADTGMGISPEILDRIFDPFFTTKELGKGTGLGLSTVIGIVKKHGGWVSVHSEVGKGTAFQVYLPAAGENG